MEVTQSTIQKAFKLIIEGNTKSEIRAQLGLDKTQWSSVLASTKLKQLFDVPVASPEGLIHEIEEELWETLELYNSKNKSNRKNRGLLHKRIQVLSARYSCFLLPIKPTKRDM